MIPAELFHGTSMTRWKSISRSGLLSGKPKIYRKVQKPDKRIYLTSDIENAAYYALKTVEMEKRLSRKKQKKFGLTKIKGEGLVVSVTTAGLDPRNLFRDPEDVQNIGWYIYVGKIDHRLIKKDSWTSITKCSEILKAQIISDIELSMSEEIQDAVACVDRLEIMIEETKKFKEKGEQIDWSLKPQIELLKKHDEIATGGLFFPKVIKELEKRGLSI